MIYRDWKTFEIPAVIIRDQRCTYLCVRLGRHGVPGWVCSKRTVKPLDRRLVVAL